MKSGEKIQPKKQFAKYLPAEGTILFMFDINQAYVEWYVMVEWIDGTKFPVSINIIEGA